ncbi:GGDEF domain-containing protein [Cellulosimicrobium sp. NPDC057127]|uniref:GGDEF domain-containing protein n=1 Tax=Cellulosimicrobium sp. NPDC057127 TaxID=3346026 RepID=UPI00364555DC
MYDAITHLARQTTARAAADRTGLVGQLARPVMVVGSSIPVGQLEVVFRRPDVDCVAVQDDEGEDRLGLVMRAALASALTGRLGYGRAVLERRPASTVTDWSPLVVDRASSVSDVATHAMSRPGTRRYDDVLVGGSGHWASVSAADLMRSLVSTLAAQSTRDHLTGLATRRATWHLLAQRCRLVASSGTRVALVLLDVRGMSAVNARHGQPTGDAVLVELADRLGTALPRGCEAGRVDGDRFAVLATLPAMDDIQAAVSVEALRAEIVGHLTAPSRALPADAWPSVDTATVWSVAGAADADELVREAEHRLAAARSALPDPYLTA